MASAEKLSDIGEFGLIGRLEAIFSGPPTPKNVVGIGDDAAVIPLNESWDLVITTDCMLSGEHFRFDFTPPHALGQKALATNLSDIAAMGAEPLYALLTLGCPPEAWVEDVLAVARGMQETADGFDVSVIGGDTIRSPSGMLVSVTVVGRIEKGRALLRSGARPGDAVFATGTIGDSAIGLKLLTGPDSGKGAADTASIEYLKRRHLLPEPRLEEGRLLSSEALATAAIDVSDGLLADLGHICERSGVGAVVWSESIPVSNEARTIAQGSGFDLHSLVLSGGEDYELVFCCKPDCVARLHERWVKTPLAPIAQIGEIVEGSGLRIEGLPEGTERKLGRGFDHFAGP
jgi:thiamine-monophosphate kinase